MRHEPYTLNIHIHALPMMNTAATRRDRFVQAKEAAQWRTAVVCQVGNRKPEKPLLLSRVTMTLGSPREPDFENLTQGFKPILDALTQSGLNPRKTRRLIRADVLEDDSPRHVVREYHWKKAEKGKGYVHIRVEELEPTPLLDCSA